MGFPVQPRAVRPHASNLDALQHQSPQRAHSPRATPQANASPNFSAIATHGQTVALNQPRQQRDPNPAERTGTHCPPRRPSPEACPAHENPWANGNPQATTSAGPGRKTRIRPQTLAMPLQRADQRIRPAQRHPQLVQWPGPQIAEVGSCAQGRLAEAGPIRAGPIQDTAPIATTNAAQHPFVNSTNVLLTLRFAIFAAHQHCERFRLRQAPPHHSTLAIGDTQQHSSTAASAAQVPSGRQKRDSQGQRTPFDAAQTALKRHQIAMGQGMAIRLPWTTGISIPLQRPGHRASLPQPEPRLGPLPTKTRRSRATSPQHGRCVAGELAFEGAMDES